MFAGSVDQAYVCSLDHVQIISLNFLGNQGSELRFNTLSGQLVAKRDGQLITLDLPLNPVTSKVTSNVGLQWFDWVRLD